MNKKVRFPYTMNGTLKSVSLGILRALGRIIRIRIYSYIYIVLFNHQAGMKEKALSLHKAKKGQKTLKIQVPYNLDCCSSSCITINYVPS